MHRESLKALLAQGLSLAEIGRRFSKDESTVGYWVRKHGLTAVNRDKHAARGGLPRRRLEGLVDAGGSVGSMARELGVSQTTVRYWLGRWGLETKRSQALASSRRARASGVARLERACDRHGLVEFSVEGRG